MLAFSPHLMEAFKTLGFGIVHSGLTVLNHRYLSPNWELHFSGLRDWPGLQEDPKICYEEFVSWLIVSSRGTYDQV